MTYQQNSGSASQNGEGDLQNEAQTSPQPDTTVTQPGSRPVRYEIVDKHGYVGDTVYDSAVEAAAAAKRFFPDQEQDEDRTGKGWDVQAVRNIRPGIDDRPMDWQPISLAPDGETVWTKIHDDDGERNVTQLTRSGNLWFLPDGSMYVYYTPTHWHR